MNKPALSIIKTDLPVKWQQILSDLITDPKELAQILKLDDSSRPPSLAAQEQFPLKVPLPFVNKMNKGDWNDPLLKQVWPAIQEEIVQSGYVSDPLKEAEHNPVAGLLHKYTGRVLLTAAPHCAIHCRYCFRRHFDYLENSPSREHWQRCFDYIQQDKSIEEVILSGGDPLALANKQLSWLLDHLEAIEHVSTIRIHTRLPIVVPQRVNNSLISMLRGRRITIVMVVHCNHAQELCIDTTESLRNLSANGVKMLNQTVILNEINDSSSCLSTLSKKLFSADVLPYYLHLPDEVSGTAHFDVARYKAQDIVKEMQTMLPGYLVPTLVKEEAGKAAKTRLL